MVTAKSAMEQQWRHIQLLYTFEILSWRNINLQASALLQKGPPFVDLRPHRDLNEHLGPYFFPGPYFLYFLPKNHLVPISLKLGPHFDKFMSPSQLGAVASGAACAHGKGRQSVVAFVFRFQAHLNIIPELWPPSLPLHTAFCWPEQQTLSPLEANAD